MFYEYKISFLDIQDLQVSLTWETYYEIIKYQVQVNHIVNLLYSSFDLQMLKLYYEEEI